MTVYVDEAAFYPKPHRGMWCHLIADTPEELRSFAKAIGMKPAWIQKEGTAAEHFDIFGDARRKRAIDAGAIPVSRRELGRLIAAKREAE